MNIVALICARGGSKGLRNKNLLKINNKSLIERAINQAKSIKEITRVFVSTDSKKIAIEAIKFGADVPFIRPKYLAADNTPEIKVWKHAVNFFKKRMKLNIDFLVIVPTTSPLRKINQIKQCIRKAKKENLDILFTATKSNRNPFFNMVKINKNKISLICKSKKMVYRRQDAPECYDLTTICYVVKVKFLFGCSNLFEGKSNIIKIPKKNSIDIDDLVDFKIAKFLLKNEK